MNDDIKSLTVTADQLHEIYLALLARVEWIEGVIDGPVRLEGEERAHWDARLKKARETFDIVRRA